MNVDLSITLSSLVKKWLVDISNLQFFNFACRYLPEFSSSFPEFSTLNLFISSIPVDIAHPSSRCCWSIEKTLLIHRVEVVHPSSRYCSSVGTLWSLNDFSISHSRVLEWLLYNIKSVTCRDLDLEHFSPNRFIQLQASSKFFWGVIFLIFFQIESLGLILFQEKDSNLLLWHFYRL